MTDPAYESWLDAGLGWLQENWTDQEWSEMRGGLVAALGLAAAEDDPVAHALIAEIDALPADEQRATVLEPTAAAGLVQHAVGAAAADRASPAPIDGGPTATPGPGDAGAPDLAAEVEPVYVEGTGWMRWDAAAAAWVAMEPDSVQPAGPTPSVASVASDAAGPDAADSAAPDTASGGPVAEPAEAAAAVAEQVVLPALAEALAAIPELAQLPAEELNHLMSEVLTERVAAMG